MDRRPDGCRSAHPGRHERPAGAGQRDAYLRRYGLSAITGVAQQDADGAGGTGQPERDPRQEPAGQKLRAEIDGMLGKLTPDKVAAAENAWRNSRTMPELAQVRNRVKELAAAPAQSAPAPAAARRGSGREAGAHAGTSGQDQPAGVCARRRPG